MCIFYHTVAYMGITYHNCCAFASVSLSVRCLCRMLRACSPRQSARLLCMNPAHFLPVVMCEGAAVVFRSVHFDLLEQEGGEGGEGDPHRQDTLVATTSSCGAMALECFFLLCGSSSGKPLAVWALCQGSTAATRHHRALPSFHSNQRRSKV